MVTFSPQNFVQDRDLERSTTVGEPAPLMDEYILTATKKLEGIAARISRGESVDGDSRDWMLAQVDYLIDLFGNDNLKFEDEVRSSVLQLVMAIANLNEQIRHQTSLNQ